MNVEQSMCASSGHAEHWEQIDWDQCERRVKGLPACIVKAKVNGWSRSRGA